MVWIREPTHHERIFGQYAGANRIIAACYFEDKISRRFDRFRVQLCPLTDVEELRAATLFDSQGDVEIPVLLGHRTRRRSWTTEKRRHGVPHKRLAHRTKRRFDFLHPAGERRTIYARRRIIAAFKHTDCGQRVHSFLKNGHWRNTQRRADKLSPAQLILVELGRPVENIYYSRAVMRLRVIGPVFVVEMADPVSVFVSHNLPT